MTCSLMHRMHGHATRTIPHSRRKDAKPLMEATHRLECGAAIHYVVGKLGGGRMDSKPLDNKL